MIGNERFIYKSVGKDRGNCTHYINCKHTGKKYSGRIDHFTVVCSVTWPLDGSEVGVDLVLLLCHNFATVDHEVSPTARALLSLLPGLRPGFQEIQQ